MPLHAWSAATELAKLDRDFEDVLNHFMSPDWAVGKPYSRAHHPPAIESFVDSDQLILRADLPGVEPKDVEIRVDSNILTISGSRIAATRNETIISFSGVSIRKFRACESRIQKV